MIGTGLAYQELGAYIATILIIIFVFVIVIRYMMAFRHYIYHGDIGDFEKSAFISAMEGEWTNIVKYAFTGYHPGILIVDTFMLGLFSVTMIVLWAPMIVMLLLVLLGYTMRKRIAHKQEFTARLEGTHKE